MNLATFIDLAERFEAEAERLGNIVREINGQLS